MSMKLRLAGMGGAPAQTYVDDVFSTWLYTGNGSTQTITNGIDLAGNGGMVWTKARNDTTTNACVDTARGGSKSIYSNAAQNQQSTGVVSSFNSNGFTLGVDTYPFFNNTGTAYASWTFRKAAKFFDVVTYTGTGSARTIAHSLGVAPGMIFVKRTDTTSNWQVYHNGLTSAAYSIQLNLTNAQASAPTVWNSTAPTSSVFSVGTDATVNASGGTYVAYLFAHDTSSTGIIQCGSFTTDWSGKATVNLGWEPQWLFVKTSDTASNWYLIDSMRGFSVGTSTDPILFANTSAAESSGGDQFTPTATGFIVEPGWFLDSKNIYMAIRRPNKPPTSGTQVFSPSDGNYGSAPYARSNFPVDLALHIYKPIGGINVADRLRGTSDNDALVLATNSTVAESHLYSAIFNQYMNGMSSSANTNAIYLMFKRAPGFFDVVCYTGDMQVGRSVAHNLTVVPELIIVKNRSAVYNWIVQPQGEGTKVLKLNANSAKSTDTGYWSSTAPTSSVFTVGASAPVNGNGNNLVAYLFATLAGISKVGSYTGNGTSQNIDCGFAAGARFVLIKRTDNTGDWFVWDTVRGIVAANDPHLSLNTTAAEVTTDDSIDPYSAGFTVNQVAATNINVSSATYIYLAIA